MMFWSGACISADSADSGHPDNYPTAGFRIIGHSDGHKALNEREPEPRTEHRVAHALKLLQAALELMHPFSRITATDGQRALVATCDGDVGAQCMGLSVSTQPVRMLPGTAK